MNQPHSAPLNDLDLQAWLHDGYVIVRGLIPAAEVTALREAVMRQADIGPISGLWDDDFTKRHTVANDPLINYPRLLQVHRHLDQPIGPVTRRWFLHERIAAITETLLGEPAFAAQSMVYFKPPGARGQDFHQDNFYLSVMPGTCLAAWMALDDADASNGGLSIVPGSHCLDIICPEKADLTQSFVADRTPIPAGMHPLPVTLAAGDVLFFNGQVIHGSTPNTTTDRFRRSLICHYLPRSSSAIHEWYQPLLDFSGGEHRIGISTAGGPCGAPMATSRH